MLAVVADSKANAASTIGLLPLSVSLYSMASGVCYYPQLP